MSKSVLGELGSTTAQKRQKLPEEPARAGDRARGGSMTHIEKTDLLPGAEPRAKAWDSCHKDLRSETQAPWAFLSIYPFYSLPDFT